MRSAVIVPAWLALALCLALASLLPVRAGVDGANGPLPPGEARKWLGRIHAAAHERNYQGTLVFSVDGSLSSARVAHFGDGASSYERIEVLDGRMQQIYRHNDRVYTLWPDKRVAVVEERDPRQASLRQVIDPRAAEQYELREQGRDHVAGREAQVLLLSPLDKYRFAQRLWVDTETGLILRADLLGPKQQVLESSAFSQVEIGVKAQPQTVLQPMKQLNGYRQVRPAQHVTRLDSEGWTLRSPVPGFELSSCTRRTLDPVDGAAPPTAVTQAVFSDGLTQISVFVEPIDARHHRQPLLTQLGATGTLMRPHGDAWVTIIGDVPASTLQQFFQALERRK